MKSEELKALISLLEDPDDRIFDEVRRKIMEIGPSVIDDLESAWENSLDPYFHERVEDIISLIQKSNLEEKISLWLKKENVDLIQGAILMAKFQYPDINAAEIREEIEKIKQAIWLELNENLTPLENINVMNQVFYRETGFGGNLKNVYNPQNNFIQIVLERKKGSPIMLGLIYLAIAQQLDLPVFGVDLPYHFVLAYCKYTFDEELNAVPNREEVIFYINPINNGLIFSRSEIKDYLKRMKLEEEARYFNAVGNRRVVKLLFLQLKQCYVSNNDKGKAAELQKLIDLLD